MGFFSSLFKKKEVRNTSKLTKSLSGQIVAFTSSPQEKLALAKALLAHAIIDFKHEYYYLKGIDTDIRNDIDFSMYSTKFLELYNQHEAEAEEHQKILESINYEDYDPRDYTDKNLSQLDLFEITPVFNGMVRNLNSPKEKFIAKLLIIDDMLH